MKRKKWNKQNPTRAKRIFESVDSESLERKDNSDEKGIVSRENENSLGTFSTSELKLEMPVKARKIKVVNSKIFDKKARTRANTPTKILNMKKTVKIIDLTKDTLKRKINARKPKSGH